MLKRGFTLLELLVALGLLSIVLMFVFNTFTYQHATYTVTDQVSEASQNQRAIARLLERDIRNAGYLVPPAAAVFRFSALEPHWMLVATASGIVGVLPYEVYKLARPRREPA